MSHVDSYRDLHVWQKSMDLVTECYRIAKQFPQDERFGLSSQLQRAAVSVPANIAEGNGRGSTQSYLNHLWIANGSLRELETHLLISARLGYVPEDEIAPLMRSAEEIGRMLMRLRQSLSERQS